MQNNGKNTESHSHLKEISHKNKHNDHSVSNEITLVTAYLDIGRFEKGESGSLFYDPYMYRRWMATFKFITNPVVAYFEDPIDVERFRIIRSSLPHNRTKIIQLRRQDTWAFSLEPSISRIFSQPSYPMHRPNTVNANYSCAMHSKYEFLTNSIHLNPFNTKYFAWTDVGYFREILHSPNRSKLHIRLPPKFNQSALAVNEVFSRNESMPITTIFHNNMVWLGGGFFIGTTELVLQWAEQYKHAVQEFLQRMLMNTDQQVIYSWFNLCKNTVPIKIYKHDGRYNSWFHLGYICKD